MYENDRDQINYHGFLRALRDMHEIPQGGVCKGICTISGMNRFEKGNRMAEKLMRDRLTARLGISGETYEDYLLPAEYDAWEHRMRIIKTIEDRNLSLAKAELTSYEQRPTLNNLNKQFIKTMQYNILLLEVASDEALLECVTEAIKYTVPSMKKALNGDHLLADQEINLIAEYMRLSAPKKVVRDEYAWRIGEYQKLISYMDNSRWEKLQKAKVYPKVTYYICRCIMDKDCNEAELRYGLKLCDVAIDLLRDTGRLYYFIELLEMRRILAGCMLECKFLSQAESEEVVSMLEENNTWEDVLKEVYDEYHVPLYMSNFCYLYYETECHNIVIVEETRRKMLGISRVKLCEGVCADRTLVRIEREGVRPTIEIMRSLFDKMGMCAEYKRAPIVTTDAEVLTVAYEKMIRAANDIQIEDGLKIIEYIKNHIDMDLPYNRQEISRFENYLLHKAKQVDDDEFVKREKESLAYTVPIQKLARKDLFFTRYEMQCIIMFALDMQTDITKRCLKIVEEQCWNVMEKGLDISQIAVFDLMMEKFSSTLGDAGRYEESTQMSEFILKECLSHYRIGCVANATYNKIWNDTQDKKCDGVSILRRFQRCIAFSEIKKRYNAAAFFQNKSDAFKDYFSTPTSCGPS